MAHQSRMWHHLIRRVFATFHAGTHVPPSTSPSPVPNHLCHTNTPSCPSAARAADNASFVWHQPGVRLPMTTRGRRDPWHHQPTSATCQTVSSHRGGLKSCELGLQPQQANGYSGRSTETHGGKSLLRLLRSRSSSALLPSRSLSLHLSVCEQLWVLECGLHTTQRGGSRWPGMTDIWQRGDRRGTQGGKVQHEDEWLVEIHSQRIKPCALGVAHWCLEGNVFIHQWRVECWKSVLEQKNNYSQKTYSSHRENLYLRNLAIAIMKAVLADLKAQ